MGRDCANIAIDRDVVIDAKVARFCPVIRTPLEFELPLVLMLPKSVTLLLSPPSIIIMPDELAPVVETLPVTLIVLLLELRSDTNAVHTCSTASRYG